jgi:DNA-binding MarR family transcriptional regulator
MAVDRQAEEIIDRLLDLFRRMQGALAAAAAVFGLTPAEARTLIWLDQPAPMGAMAEALHCDASYVTQLSDGLEKQGYIERVPDPRDRRVRQLVLTKEGRRLRTRLLARVHATSPAIVSFNGQQREQLLALLRLTAEGGIPDLAPTD